MESIEHFLHGRETKLFDPQDFPSGEGSEVLDASVVRRVDRWWMYLAGQTGGNGATQIFSASLDPGAPLSGSGWKLTRDEAGELAPLAGQSVSRPWDGNGGRHCPSYVKGWDPKKCEWVERIYYAGAAENLWGPIRLVFWNGTVRRGSINPHLHLPRVRSGNMGVYTSRTSSITVASGECGMSLDRTMKTTWCTATLRVTMELPDGAATQCSRRQR